MPSSFDTSKCGVPIRSLILILEHVTKPSGDLLVPVPTVGQVLHSASPRRTKGTLFLASIVPSCTEGAAPRESPLATISPEVNWSNYAEFIHDRSSAVGSLGRRAMGSCQRRRMAINRSPKQSTAPATAAAELGRCSILPSTTIAAPISAATA